MDYVLNIELTSILTYILILLLILVISSLSLFFDQLNKDRIIKKNELEVPMDLNRHFD
jgi:hypothetical protein